MSSGVRTRLLAVLFVDQVDSTATLHEIGDVEADRLRRRLEPVLDDAITQHDGTIVKSTGDGRMAVFESATDAIDAGVRMHMRCDRYNRAEPDAPALRIRVGVSVGDVTEEDGDYFGTTVVEAARLESAAGQHRMLCTDLARALVGNRSRGRFTTRLDVEAKGFDEPIGAWAVEWEPEADQPQRTMPAELGAGGRFGFAGRDHELAAARRAWSAAVDGELNGILIGGEPGVGKTRLARELALGAHDDGALVLYGRCDDGVGAAFQPFVTALGHFVEHTSPTVDQLGKLPGELRRLLPDLDTHVSGLPETVHADSETEQYRLFDAVSSWIETIAADQPVLLVVDDLHWAAQPTMHLIRHLLRRPTSASFCVVGTYRDTAADESSLLLRFLGDAQRQGDTATIQLTGLDTGGIAALLQDSDVGLDARAAHELADRLREQTAGNAFFLGEMISLLRERGPDALSHELPHALSQVVLDRVQRLSPTTVALLDMTSAAAGEVGLDVLTVATGLGHADLVDAAEEALHGGLLIEIPDAPVRYRFQHDLVRTTVYEHMSLGRRSRRHSALAHAIDEVHARDLSGHLEDLAYHYARSTDPDDTDRAVVVTQLAGDEASARLGFATAVEHYETALTLMDRFGCTHPERLRGRLTLSLGVAMKRAGMRGTRAKLFEAAEIAEAQDDPATIVNAALANTRGFFSSAGRTDEARVRLLEMALRAVDPDDSAHTAKLMANLSVELTFGRDHERRQELSEQSLAMAERIEDPVCLAHVVNQRIGFLWNADGLHRRVELCQRLQEIAARLDEPQWRYTAATSQFQAAMECGDLALADRCLDQMRATMDDLRQPVVLSYLRMRESVRSIVAGDLERGEQLATECFELGQAAGQPDAATFYFGQLINLRFHQGRLGELEAIVAQEADANPGLPSLRAALAVLYCETDRPEDARPHFEALTDGHDDLLRDLSWLVMTALLADACFQLDDVDRAATLHAALAPFRQQCVDNATNWYGTVGRYLALLEHVLGRYDDADRSFADAVERHAAMPAPAILARTRADWATSLLRRPHPDRQRGAELLEQSRAAAEELGLGAVLVRATRLTALP